MRYEPFYISLSRKNCRKEGSKISYYSFQFNWRWSFTRWLSLMISYLTPSTNLILGQGLSSVLRNFGKDLARIGHKPDTHQLKLVEIKIELDKYFMFEFIFEISFSFLSAEKKAKLPERKEDENEKTWSKIRNSRFGRHQSFTHRWFKFVFFNFNRWRKKVSQFELITFQILIWRWQWCW